LLTSVMRMEATQYARMEVPAVPWMAIGVVVVVVKGRDSDSDHDVALDVDLVWHPLFYQIPTSFVWICSLFTG